MTQRVTFLFVFVLSVLHLQAQTVIWGDQSGQGDFAGSLAGWTVDTPSPATDSSWLWSSDGDVGNGYLALPGTIINSPTVSNGCAMYDYDFQTTGGNPPTGQTAMISNLISPGIDITGANKSLAVEFYQIFRWFQSAVFGEPYSSLSFSTDAGDTWSDQINCNPFVLSGNTRTFFGVTNNQVTINVPQEVTAGADSLWVRFTFSGSFYYWGVDDVMLVEREDFDMSTNPFFAIAPNYQTPKTQMNDIGFLIDIQNWGDQPATNVNVNAEILAGDGTSIFSGDNPYGNLDVDSTYENDPFPVFFEAQELDPGTYDVSYTVTTDDPDTNSDNDTQSYQFEVTDSIFSKDSGPTHYYELPGANYDPGDVHSLYYGAFYHVPNGDGYFADKAVFSIRGTDNSDINLAGSVIAVKLYEFEDANDDRIAQSDERTLMALGIYEITGSENVVDNVNNVPSLQVVELLGTGIDVAPALKDDTDYILMMEFDSPLDDADLGFGIAVNNDYAGNFVLGDQVDYLPVFSTFVKVGSTDTDFSSGGLGYSTNPVARLAISTSDPTPVHELPGINGITLSPNPVKDQLFVNVDAEENIGTVNIVVFDANGMAIQYDHYDFSGNSNYSLNVSHLAAGQYYLGIKSEKGQKFTPFQVQR